MTPNEKAKILSEALPYIKKFTKKIMVIKYGGIVVVVVVVVVVYT